MREQPQYREPCAVWLLCALVVVMSIVSPLCSACDGIGTVHNAVVHAIANTADKLPPGAPADQCNGVCSCCGFHWLPVVEPAVSQVALLTPVFSAQEQRLASRQLAPLFQPPRA